MIYLYLVQSIVQNTVQYKKKYTFSNIALELLFITGFFGACVIVVFFDIFIMSYECVSYKRYK